MEIWLITLIAMWINPIFGYILARFSAKKVKLRKLLFIFFSTIALIEILTIIVNISFTSSIVDFIFTSFFYLGICFGIWILKFNKKAILKTSGIILAVLIFGLNYLLSTVGALGVGFALNDWTPRQEIKLDNNLIYKEIPLGMATDDYRGKRVEIYKRIGFLPLERKILTKSYINETGGFIYKLDVKYNSKTKDLYLFGADRLRDKEINYWYDTININNARKHNTRYSQ